MARPSWEPLLELEHAEGVAGIYRDRDDGSHWLSGGEHGGSGMRERRLTLVGLRESWVYGGRPPLSAAAFRRLSPAAVTVLLEQNRLRAGERVGAVVAHDRTIAVDGRPQRFLAGRCGDGWAAVATLDGLTLTITAEQVAPEAVALERVADVEPYLVEPPD